MNKTALAFLGVFASFEISLAASAMTVSHSLEITLTPAVKTLAITDTVTLTPARTYHFFLNKNLRASVTSKGDQLRLVQSTVAGGNLAEYELTLGADDDRARLQYSGVIFDPVVNNESSGLISNDGAALFGNTGWVPDFGEKVTYQIQTLNLPAEWILASPKEQLQIPQQDLYLVAGPLTEYNLANGPTTVPLKVYLRSADPALAQVFLNRLPGYMDHYQKTLGDYPYASFAVIENFWETGFGMPAFTLLGPNVIRWTYILNSSLPHELLHNWWGNSVFVDYDRGNWCEGLTTYMADHWQQEVLKADRDYRLQTLMNYQDYTNAAKDFPLRDFKQRLSFSSQAVGYGKGMMLFHMLRARFGEDVFARAMRLVYQQYRGQSISYEEFEQVFEKLTGTDLRNYFKQWLDRTGAPKLTVKNAAVATTTLGKYEVSFELQVASAQNYELDVPARVTLADGETHSLVLHATAATTSYRLVFEKPVKTLEVDPQVDIFRDLDVSERPVGWSNVFGAKKVYLISGDAGLAAAYLNAWRPAIETEIVVADEKLLLNLPPDGAVVLLGDSPNYEKLMTEALAGQDFKVTADTVTLMGTAYARTDYKTAIVARSLTKSGLVLAWIRGTQSESLAPRLLHYGKYGVLAFSTSAVPLKAAWPVLKSPLRVEF